ERPVETRRGVSLRTDTLHFGARRRRKKGTGGKPGALAFRRRARGAYCAWITSILTRAVPARYIPISRAAAAETSITRLPVKGPRSLMRTTTERSLRRLVTRTSEPKGREGCAAVNASGRNGSPLAVGWPASSWP